MPTQVKIKNGNLLVNNKLARTGINLKHLYKIDRAFVNDIVTEPATQNIVRTIIAMATAMGAEIFAEGVESTDQLSQLSSLECHRAQGYLFSRPVHVDDVPRVVKFLEDPSHWRDITGRS